ncbi:AcrR family transcriptional regulator [Amycolatopsis bartoniae]|uniref:TetR family transcriptional regulator n=1 Tax=Amycolatopsis bartoniae TaxID=941986 RepID=A0A8H9ISN6_9PSEU|nr:TetR/AcrR family transcriptional regulator [Amycolatopsis bartoniae]MBB2937906.1 AcrR family transcriptional regulator [Amycolatopsis bartoniae]TVT08597.1 TetR family transcriptional regulator [Amycolatopsis bartoniae]GHF41602.1 TetR family transcriptional regulator [Amycolatopsis bartoniae]
MPDTEPLGRRERKKAATRQALADAALRLFLERGYDEVGIREIAEAADVSTTTLFKHFPGKEALVFDQEDEIKDALLAAVRDRPAGQSIPAALRDHVLRARLPKDDPQWIRLAEFVARTPALRDYARRMWLRHEADLAAVIAEEAGLPADDASCRALAHFALETRDLGHGSADPEAALRRAFDLLERGWEGLAHER